MSVFVCAVRVLVCAVRVFVCAVRVLVCAVRVFVCAVRVLVCAVRVFVCAVSILFVLWATVFDFDVRFLLSLQSICYCCEKFAVAVTVVGHRRNLPLDNSHCLAE